MEIINTDLLNEIEEYLKIESNLQVAVKKMPFYDKLKYYIVKSNKANNTNLTVSDFLCSLYKRMPRTNISEDFLKETIDKYINNGGILEISAKSLPFFNQIETYRQKINKTENKSYTIADIFNLLGYKYDKEFSEYTKLIKNLPNYVDDEGYVDSIKKDKTTDQPYAIMSYFCSKYNMSYADFLYILTPYQFKTTYINVDYVAYVQKELLAMFPDRQIQGLRKSKPVLYEKVRSLKDAISPQSTIGQILKELGFEYISAGTSNPTVLDKDKILQELQTICPNKDASELNTKNAKLYKKLLQLASQDGDKTIKEFLNENGYNYAYGSRYRKLKLMKVDSTAYYSRLTQLKEEYLKEHPMGELTEQEKFHFNIQMAETLSHQMQMEIYNNNQLITNEESPKSDNSNDL